MTKEEKKKEYQKAYYQKNRKEINEKRKENRKAWREKNKEKIKEREKDYYEKNKENRKAWREKNRERINEYLKEYNKKKRKIEPLFKLKSSLRCASYKAFKGKEKPETTEELLGCSYNDFKHYITAQFVGNMSWDNYGDVWHVDHITPLSVIEDVSQEELISSLCHYSNLQPLFACHNCSKHGKLDYEYPAIYKTNLLHNSNKKQL